MCPNMSSSIRKDGQYTARRTTRTPLASLLLGLALALTATNASASTQIINVTVTTVTIYKGDSGSQAAEIYFSPAVPGAEGCSYAPGNIVWIDFQSAMQPDGKSLYATVLAAFLAGRTVNFGVAGCADSGLLPNVYRVDVGS